MYPPQSFLESSALFIQHLEVRMSNMNHAAFFLNLLFFFGGSEVERRDTHSWLIFFTSIQVTMVETLFIIQFFSLISILK